MVPLILFVIRDGYISYNESCSETHAGDRVISDKFPRFSFLSH
jgi:hypothetical protein